MRWVLGEEGKGEWWMREIEEKRRRMGGLGSEGEVGGRGKRGDEEINE